MGRGNCEFVVISGYIRYGATVKLICDSTGMTLPRMVSRRLSGIMVGRGDFSGEK